MDTKMVGLAVIVGLIFYYGWPIIEAIIMVLPIGDTFSKLAGLIAPVTGFLSSLVTSQPRGQQSSSSNSNQNYSSGLANAPGSYMDDDSDDEDVGKAITSTKKPLDYDSDEKDDDNEVGTSGGGNELIDLGGSKAAGNIPKLSGPK